MCVHKLYGNVRQKLLGYCIVLGFALYSGPRSYCSRQPTRLKTRLYSKKGVREYSSFT